MENEMRYFQHAEFMQVGPTEVGAEASTLGLPVGEMPEKFRLEHVGIFVRTFVDSGGSGLYKHENPDHFMTAIIFND